MEAVWERFQGPLGGALRMGGAVIRQRLDARGQTLSGLSDKEMIDMLYISFREAAPSPYLHVDRARMEEAVAKMGEALPEDRLDLAGSVSATGTMNSPRRYRVDERDWRAVQHARG